MCPRATAQQGGATLARAAAASFVGAASVHSFGEEDYIDLDLSSCGEFEFRVRRGSADEPPCPSGVAAAPSKAATKSGAKMQEVHDADGGGCGGGRRSAATVAPVQHSHSAGFRDAPAAARARAEGSRRRRAARTVQAKLQASRAFFRSLFARTPCSDERRHGAAARARSRAAPYGESKALFGETKDGYGSVVCSSTSTSTSRAAPTTLRGSIELEKLVDEEELAARQRKSFSGVIRWRHLSTSPAAAPAKPLSSSSARRSSVAGGGVIGVGPAMKRSNSARSESEGLIQGAIAYCKRSQQQQQLGLARKSVSDAARCPGPPSWPSNPSRSVPAYCYY